LLEDLQKNDKSFSGSEAKINEAKKDLDGGKDFETVVAKYSEGESVKSRGDLGWFGADEMLPEIAGVAFNLGKGQTSDVIESSLGYHIIRVEDMKTEDNQEKLHLKQIFVRRKTLADWMAEKEKGISVYIPLREYNWDKSTGEVEFKNKDLYDFENNLNTNSSNDISIMF
jgi:foldase protein PrsA